MSDDNSKGAHLLGGHKNYQNTSSLNKSYLTTQPSRHSLVIRIETLFIRVVMTRKKKPDVIVQIHVVSLISPLSHMYCKSNMQNMTCKKRHIMHIDAWLWLATLTLRLNRVETTDSCRASPLHQK